MEINKLNIEKNLNNDLINEQSQKNFLTTTLGKGINTAIDIGIRTILPDFIEEQIINLKDNMVNYGLKEGINKSIEDALNFGKSAIGVITGNFENVSQMQSALQSGGVIDSLSTVIDEVVNRVKKAGLINNNVANTIKQGKNVILNNVESNIQKTFNNQIKSFENIEKNIKNWKDAFNKKDFNIMEKEYNKIQVALKNLVPLEKTISEARTIENLHNLIKNNGKNFDLTQEEIELANKLK